MTTKTGWFIDYAEPFSRPVLVMETVRRLDTTELIHRVHTVDYMCDYGDSFTTCRWKLDKPPVLIDEAGYPWLPMRLPLDIEREPLVVVPPQILTYPDGSVYLTTTSMRLPKMLPSNEKHRADAEAQMKRRANAALREYLEQLHINIKQTMRTARRQAERRHRRTV